MYFASPISHKAGGIIHTYKNITMSTSYQKGIKLALLTALISGFAVFINKFGVKLFESSSVYTTAKNLVAAILLTGMLLIFKNHKELKNLAKKQWIQLITIGLIGGSIPFLLFFHSLMLIPAPQAAFIHKTLFLWVALFSYPFLKERLSGIQLTALGILFVGVFLFAAPSSWSFGMGSIMAFAATLLWAVENIIAKRALKNISAVTVGWSRMTFGSLFLLIYLAFTGNIADIVPNTLTQAGMTLLVGAVLFGYVYSWYSALKHAPATVVASVLVIAAPITAILNGAFVKHLFPTKVIVPILFMGAGIFLIIKYHDQFLIKFRHKRSEF